MLTQYIGDSNSHDIELSWKGAAFLPGTDWGLIFTLKTNATDSDAEALFQKETGAGITVNGSTATVAVIPVDTDSLPPGNPVFDIQAKHVIDGTLRTVAVGRLKLIRDITRETAPSLPIYTTQPPTYSTIVFNRFLGHYELLYLGETDGDGFPILRSEFYSTAPPADAPLVLNRFTGLQELLFIDETDGDGFPILKTEPV